MTARLEHKTALVTGAARGQGAAAARRFVAEGARVVLADVLDEEGKALAAELGDAARYQHLDVSSEDDWAAAVAGMDRLDVLVNNAGVLHFSPLADTKLADYQRVININQVGTFLGMRAAVPLMRTAGGGSIVNLSSVEGLAAAPLLTAYTASKFAIRGMTKVAAVELGQYGIRVNSVHPGMIDTDMIKEAAGGVELDLNRIARRVALRRAGRADEIADLVVFLASDESSYCTGAEFVADGGATATHALNVT
ncbi:glucose 1-dehydrogenase [Pseudonocardia acaciae]|uniref:glucose 1-dehydrogenase n=1 Tax=Pseudonocardia acaciae TaxID=551276 RepID=UPI0004901800|nr:glucose 1-dehydrogenase [Pseudonocardia acaciae]